jgi:hypothetical protein
MHLAHLVLLTALSWGGPPADDLIAKLGSPRFSDREQAAAALRVLGREALPALRLSKEAGDLEVRTRVRALIEEIETTLMIQPTRVRLNYRDTPIAEVARGLGEQANVTINVVENNLIPNLRARRITLEESEPVPFWKALDELCRAGNLQLNHSIQIVGVGAANRMPVLNLFPSAAPPPPTALSGPFRVSTLSLVHHKERNFQTMVQNGPMALQNGVPIDPRAHGQGQAGDGWPGVTTESFMMSLSVMSEPRLSVALDGGIKVAEAYDDRGNPLAVPEPRGAIHHNSGYNGMAHVNGSTNLTLSVPLKMPEKPGTAIKTFKATIPVVVMARKDDPLVVPLTDDGKGKTFQNESIRIEVHDVKQEPGQPFTLIDLTVKLLRRDEGAPQAGPLGQEFFAFRQNQANPQNQIEILDGQGHPYHQWFPMQNQAAADGMRMSLRLMPTDGVGAPAQIRYYDLSKTPTEIEVELKDVPLP